MFIHFGMKCILIVMVSLYPNSKECLIVCCLLSPFFPLMFSASLAGVHGELDSIVNFRELCVRTSIAAWLSCPIKICYAASVF